MARVSDAWEAPPAGQHSWGVDQARTDLRLQVGRIGIVCGVFIIILRPQEAARGVERAEGSEGDDCD